MADRVADHLGGRDIVHLRCSPLERAQETMAPIAEALDLPVVIDGRVIEAENHLEGQQVALSGALRQPGTGGSSATRSSRAGASRTPRSSPGCGSAMQDAAEAAPGTRR